MTSGSLEGMNERADELIESLRSAARPLLIVISGPSGVGKDTVIQRMRELVPEAYYAVTATTRERRPGEVDGVHYFFYTPEQFNAHLAANEFMEHANVYGNLYGVPKAPVRDALRRGRDVVVKVDPQGAQTIRGIAPEALLIFLLPPSMSELYRRLHSRNTDNPSALDRRIRIASREIATSEHFDYYVINDTVEQAVQEIQDIIAVEKRRIHPREVSL